MSNYIKAIHAKGLFGRYDLQQDFYPGINVLYSNNGGGKTTLLHILANILNGDFERFAFLEFQSISVLFDDEKSVKLNRSKQRSQAELHDTLITLDINEGEILKTFSVSEIQNDEFKPRDNFVDLSQSRIPSDDSLIMPAAYFPAFRSVIDAYKSNNLGEENTNLTIDERVTTFVREWLLPFVPHLRYPSIIEIERELNREIAASRLEAIENYFKTVNKFLEGKVVYVDKSGSSRKHPGVEILFSGGSRSKGLITLSSGERQVCTFFFAATFLDKERVILIDEPEISLHVDWQRLLLQEISNHLDDHQFIICTHSPIIGADYMERRMELKLLPIQGN